MKLQIFKMDDIWCFAYGNHIERGFETKDEAKMMGEMHVVNLRKAEAKKRKADKAKKESAEE